MLKKTVITRTTILMALVLAVCLSIFVRLYDLQIINGPSNVTRSERKFTYSYSVSATRGEILDRYGRPLVTNRTTYAVRFNMFSFNKSIQNDMILTLIRLFDETGTPYYNDTLPISEFPYKLLYTEEEGAGETRAFYSLLDKNKIDKDMTASDIFEALCALYGIDPGLSHGERRAVAGVRYEMDIHDFSINNPFTFATGIPIELVSMIKERSYILPGVTIDLQPVREYRTDYAAHVLGRVGKIFKEDYDSLKAKGYRLDDIVGNDGAEKAFENYLRGMSGTSTVEVNAAGRTTNMISTNPAQPGDNCILTLDIRLQEVAEKSMARVVEEIRQEGENSSDPKKPGADVGGCSVVAMNPKTGEIYVLASYPTYDISTYSLLYNDLLADPEKPLFNRAISGLYAPGSVFKMLVAAAGLESGVITPQTYIYDQGRYMYYWPSYAPQCWIYRQYGGTHGNENVGSAIRDSCNYFFYEVGRLTGISTLEEYGGYFGLGQPTGIELAGESRGAFAGLKTVKNSRPSDPTWHPGDTLSASIGQSFHMFTPLQLASYISTLVNGGTRYRPHILKSVKTYDYSETVHIEIPEIVSQIDISDANYKAIMDGMREVAENGTAANVFSNYPIRVGGKTGSVQIFENQTANGVFAAFAPFDDPEIVIVVIMERAGSGNRIAPIARDIFDAYFDSVSNANAFERENELLM